MLKNEAPGEPQMTTLQERVNAPNDEFAYEPNDPARQWGWRHDINTKQKNTPDRTATRLALKFIDLIEKSLEKEGFSIKTGVEIEINASQEECDMAEEIISQMIAQEAEKTQACQNTSEQAHFPASARLPSHNGLKRYVNEVSWDDSQVMEISTKPLPPLQTVQTVRYLKQSLLQAKNVGHTPDSRRFTPLAERLAQKGFVSKGLHFLPCDHSTAGEHINVSLWHQDANVFQDTTLRSAFANQLENASLADAALIYNGNDSIERLVTLGERKSRCHTDKTGNFGDDDPEDIGRSAPERVEYRPPDSACNPALSMLLVCSHLYGFVQAVQTVQPTANKGTHLQWGIAEHLESIIPTPDAVMPKSMPEARQQFMQRSNVMALLEHLIEKEIPPEEQESWRKDLFYFKKAVLARSEQICARGEGRTTV